MLHLIVFLALMAILIGLTRHPELRDEPDNGWRLLASLPFAYGFTGLVLFTFGFPISGVMAGFGLFSLIALASMWRSHVAFFPAKKTTTYLFGDGHGGGGFVAEFGHARGLMKDENWKAAVDEIRAQLVKEPHSFEGHRMLVSCYLDLNQPKEALKVVRSLARSPQRTDEQEIWLREATAQLEAAVKVAERLEPS